MNIISWNCRGLGNHHTVRALRPLVKTKGPRVLFLIETKLDVYEMEFIHVLLGYYNLFVAPCHGLNRGLALLWRVETGLEICNYSRHHIDSVVGVGSEYQWRLTGFYGQPNHHRRRESWALLDQLRSLDSKPWCCVGDFNEVLFPSKHKGFHDRSENHMLAFKEVVERCGLIDIGYQGVDFMWDN
jgi:exonuclease III